MAERTPHVLISVAGYLLMVAALLALAMTHCLFSRSPVVIGVQVGAAALMLWARVTFGARSFHLGANPTEGGLVTSGPYHYVRHPIYAAVFAFVLAGVLAHLSGWSVLWLGVALLGVAARMWTEETLLAARYPDYRDYAARTKRMIPWLI